MSQSPVNSFSFLEALKAFCKDHFSHFGCMPAGFEYEGDVLEFDAYMELLNDAELQGITCQVPAEHEPYPLPEKMGYCGESFRNWMFGHFVPTYHQWRLYQAVCKAMFEHELTYNSDIYDFVVKELADILTPELLARNSATIPTERGAFGMEIFYIKGIILSHHNDAANREAMAVLLAKGIRVGSVIKGPYKRSLEGYSSMEVTAIDNAQGTLAMIGKKRGSRNRWQFTVGAACPRLNACIG
ncbi:MAG: hypothetical protein CML22_07305 [Rheinheimera sp.]|nr:hypothetical protein [Rheinheimera sp.]MBM34091.1 hypothetical protein [Rheinheimera sp.]